jgi:hypothetical protein
MMIEMIALHSNDSKCSVTQKVRNLRRQAEYSLYADAVSEATFKAG